VRFSIITPSYRSAKWLKLCIASVADQQADVEHIVQDAGSDDGTLDWLALDKRVNAFVEKDQGMYDAINRGLRRATGQILAYLNCDEQYLPGVLPAVEKFFERHPEVDVVFGDVVLTDAKGHYLSSRKMQTPLLHHTWVCQLSTLSCGMFFRSHLVREKGMFFNPALRDAGDAEWILRLLRQRTKMAVLKRFTSVFTCTGANLSAGANARRERRELFESAPPWARWLKPVIVLHHRLRRLVGGMYFQCPFTYAIFTLEDPQHRRIERAEKPRFAWPQTVPQGNEARL
jgi:glycosyltransferase involved in cell wall biosynthesis